MHSAIKLSLADHLLLHRTPVLQAHLPPPWNGVHISSLGLGNNYPIIDTADNSNDNPIFLRVHTKFPRFYVIKIDSEGYRSRGL